MGSLNRDQLKCPSCERNETSPKELFTHFYAQHMLKCEICQLTGFKNQHDVMQHQKETHENLNSKSSCPLCGKACNSEEEFTGHVILRHRVSYKQEANALMVLCPPCNKYICCDKTITAHLSKHTTGDLTDSVSSQHGSIQQNTPNIGAPPSYNEIFGGESRNAFPEPSAPPYNEMCGFDTVTAATPQFASSSDIRNLLVPPKFKIGDHVNAMWASTKYQYFPASIVEILEVAKKCIVRWDDGDTSGLIVDFGDIARDRIPTEAELQVGTRVLFSQGAYAAGETQLSGGQRWHQGIITRIQQANDGCKLYSGYHLKDERDGKALHRGLSREFTGYRNTQLREGILENIAALETPAVYSSPVASNAVPSPSQIQEQQLYLQNKNLPKCGDRVLAMWGRSKWQYFHATIRQVLPSLQYLIEWDDGDVTGREVNCFDVAMDTIPDANDIGVESIVLFQQGQYSAGADQQTGGVRWHQGKITKVVRSNDGTALYSGCHTKTAEDGKWVTYKCYSHTFTGLRLQELRNGPNIFDVIDDSKTNFCDVDPALRGDGTTADRRDSGAVWREYEKCRMQESIEKKSMNYLLNIENKLKETTPNPPERCEADFDVFFSYCWYDSKIAEGKGHVLKSHGKKYSDPRLIHEEISTKFRTWLDINCLRISNDTLFQQHSDAIKKSSIFMVFVSDDYASNVFCRMQFQYSCKTLKKHVIPIVVGRTGNNEWKNTVVGILLKADESKFKPHDFRGVKNQRDFEKKIKDVLEATKTALNK